MLRNNCFFIPVNVALCSQRSAPVNTSWFQVGSYGNGAVVTEGVLCQARAADFHRSVRLMLASRKRNRFCFFPFCFHPSCSSHRPGARGPSSRYGFACLLSSCALGHLGSLNLRKARGCYLGVMGFVFVFLSCHRGVETFIQCRCQWQRPALSTCCQGL